MRSVGRSLKLGAVERERLRTGAAELGVSLDDVALRRFADYSEALERWRDATNLISCGSAGELVDRHFLDSLACAWACSAATIVADLGSGAGLPGIPLAIAYPERPTLLIEPRRRRASFLRAVKRQLELERVEVFEMRSEDIPSERVGSVDVVVTRAVWSDEEVLRVAAPWMCPGGALLCLRSAPPAKSTAQLPSLLRLEQAPHYRIGSARARRLEIYRKPPMERETLRDVSRET